MEEDKGREVTVMSAPEPAILAAVDVPAWCDPRHIAVAWALSEGFTKARAAAAGGVSRRTVYDWLENSEFAGLVERLRPLTGLAQQSARVGELKWMYHQLKRYGIGALLQKTDGPGLLREIAREVGARGLGAGHPGQQLIQQFFKGPTMIQMGEVASGEVVDGEPVIIDDGEE